MDVMMSINFNDIAILNIHSVDYCCNVKGICKSKAINLLQNTYVTKKRNIIKIKEKIMTYKMGTEIKRSGGTEIEKNKFPCYRDPAF